MYNKKKVVADLIEAILLVKTGNLHALTAGALAMEKAVVLLGGDKARDELRRLEAIQFDAYFQCMERR